MFHNINVLMFNCSLGEQRTTFKNVTNPKLLNGSASTAKK